MAMVQVTVPSALHPRSMSPSHYLSLEWGGLHGLSSNLTISFSRRGISIRSRAVSLFGGAFTGQVPCDACMNGPPWSPSESRVAGDTATLKLSKIELASVPIPKCLLRTKYDNRSRRILGMSMALRLVEPPRLRGGVTASRG